MYRIVLIFTACSVLLFLSGCAASTKSVLIQGSGLATVTAPDLLPAEEPGNLVWATEKLEASGRAAVDSSIATESRPLSVGLAKAEAKQRARAELKSQLENLPATDEYRIQAFIEQLPSISRTEFQKNIEEELDQVSVSYTLAEGIVRADSRLDLWNLAALIAQAGGGRSIGASESLSIGDRREMAIAEARQMATERARQDLMRNLQALELVNGSTLQREAQIRPVLLQPMSRLVFDAKVLRNGIDEQERWEVVLETDAGEFLDALNRLIRSER